MAAGARPLSICITAVTPKAVYYTLKDDKTGKVYDYQITKGSTVNFKALEVGTVYWVGSRMNKAGRYVWVEVIKALSEEQMHKIAPKADKVKINKNAEAMFEW